MQRHTHRTTLFPYTTLFRSRKMGVHVTWFRLVRESGTNIRICFAASPAVLAAAWRVIVSMATESITSRQIVFGSIRSEEHTSELQSLRHLVCRLLLEKKKVR